MQQKIPRSQCDAEREAGLRTGLSSVLFKSILCLYLQPQESHDTMANLDSFRGVYKVVDRQDIDVDIYLPQKDRHGSSPQYPVRAYMLLNALSESANKFWSSY